MGVIQMMLDEIVTVGKHLVVTKKTSFGQILQLNSEIFSSFKRLLIDEEIDGVNYKNVMNLKPRSFTSSARNINASILSYNGKPWAIIKLTYETIDDHYKGEFKLTVTSIRIRPFIIHPERDKWIVKSRGDHTVLKCLNNFPESDFNSSLVFSNLENYRDDIDRNVVSPENLNKVISGWVLFE